MRTGVAGSLICLKTVSDCQCFVSVSDTRVELASVHCHTPIYVRGSKASFRPPVQAGVVIRACDTARPRLINCRVPLFLFSCSDQSTEKRIARQCFLGLVHERRTIATDVPVAWCMSVTRYAHRQKRLSGSTSYLGWRPLGVTGWRCRYTLTVSLRGGKTNYSGCLVKDFFPTHAVYTGAGSRA